MQYFRKSARKSKTQGIFSKEFLAFSFKKKYFKYPKRFVNSSADDI